MAAEVTLDGAQDVRVIVYGPDNGFGHNRSMIPFNCANRISNGARTQYCSVAFRQTNLNKSALTFNAARRLSSQHLRRSRPNKCQQVLAYLILQCGTHPV